jgi:hypothetical protein
MQNEISELRNQVRTLKRIVYGFGCLLVAGVVVGATSLQTVPDVIQAKKFEVVNDEGKVLVKMTMGSNQETGIIETLSDKGKQIVIINSTEDGDGIIRINDYRERRLASIGASVESSDGVVIVYKRGEPQGQLYKTAHYK